MKLHISSTHMSSQGEHPPDRQGSLYKKSNRSASYQSCWCELRGNLLFYRYGDRDPFRLIILEGCTVELQESKSEPYTFEISYPSGLPGSRTYTMAAENQESMEGWVRALSTAGFHYLRALVTELEGQFNKLNSPPLPETREDLRQTAFERLPTKRDFAWLHQEFGEEIVRLRQKWQKEREGRKQMDEESLIDF